MEDELRNTGGASIPPDSAALLLEKDREIEKLKKEITELSQQLADARAEIDDLLQVDAGEEFSDEARSSYEAEGFHPMVGDERLSTVSGDEDIKYPKLKVRTSWDYEHAMNEMPVFAVPHYEAASNLSFTTSQASDRHSCSSDESFTHLPILRTSIPQCSPLWEEDPKIPYFDENDAPPHMEHEEQVEDEDLCKEVRCIESEPIVKSADLNASEASSYRYEEPNAPSSVVKTATSVLTDGENEDKANQEIMSPPPLFGEQKESSHDHSDFVTQISEKSSSPSHDSSSRSSLKLPETRSWRSNSTGLTPTLCDSEEKNSDATGKPGNIQRKFSAFKYSFQRRTLSRDASQSSSNSGAGDEHKTPNVPTPKEKQHSDHVRRTLSRDASQSSSNSGAGDEHKTPNIPAPKEKQHSDHARTLSRDASQSSSNSGAGDEHKTPNIPTPKEKQHSDHAKGRVNESQLERPCSKKTAKNVSLDRSEDETGSHSLWPSEFKRIQGEIIELWHACNISLIHRTYFFLLFKGDPKDYIYMEVELKRLHFLKDSFSQQGNQTAENGEGPTLDSSKKALQQERHMLSLQMRKKLSEDERNNLFLKYGIGVDAKNRRLRLAHLLWSNPKDMKHVAESAAIVAKVVGFVDQEKAFKEFFSLKYAPKRRGIKKHHHFKPIKSLMSILHA